MSPPRRDRDEILQRVDLELLADQLLGARQGRGRMWRCPNPGHEQTGRTPPLSVFTGRTGIQRWKCHGCGDGGTAIDLAIRTGTVDGVAEALHFLSGEDRRSLAPVLQRSRPPERPKRAEPRPGMREGLEAYTAGCVEHLHSRAGRPVLAWLAEQRAIPLDVIIESRIGADPGPRYVARPDGVPRVFPAVTFPVLDPDDGTVTYTLSRHLRPVDSRWWNTAQRAAPNPCLAFYGPPGSGAIIVTEGPMDALSARAAGYRAAAVLGAGNVDASIADRLTAIRRRLLLAFDNDSEGHAANDRLAGLLHERGARWSCLDVPGHLADLNAWHATCRARWPAVVRASDHLGSIGLSRGAPSTPSIT